MIKYFPIILIALFLDGLQILLTLSFWGIGAVGGLSISWIPIIGQALAGSTIIVGTVFGIILNICLTTTFGAAVITFLVFNKMFYPKILLFGGTELIPMLSNFPLFTGITIASIRRKAKEERLSQMTAGSGDDSLQVEEGVIEEYKTGIDFGQTREQLLMGEVYEKENTAPQKRTRAPFLAPLHVDGIRAPRPTNDNLDRGREKYAA